MNASILEEPVHLVQELRNLLHLVDHDLANRATGVELLPDAFRILQIAAILLGLQQIDPVRLRIGLAEQRRLSGLTRAPKEEGLRARGRQANGAREHKLQFIMIN